MEELFGIALIDVPSFWELLVRFAFNFLIVFVISRCLYYPATRRRDFHNRVLVVFLVGKCKNSSRFCAWFICNIRNYPLPYGIDANQGNDVSVPCNWCFGYQCVV